jgi:hypothetical protein
MNRSNNYKLQRLLVYPRDKYHDGWTHVVLFANGLDEVHHLITQCRVQATGRFVKEQNLRVGDEPAGNTKPFLLTTTEAFPDRRSHDSVRL